MVTLVVARLARTIDATVFAASHMPTTSVGMAPDHFISQAMYGRGGRGDY